jgi:glycosyltransferase involved in cell wall biosynthesis
MTPNVLILIDTAAIGGPGRGLFQLIDNTSRDDFDYTIATFAYTNPRSTEFIDHARQHGYHLELLHERFRLDPRTLSQAAQIFCKGRHNIVQSHGYKSHVVAMYLSKRFGVPWVGLTHGWTTQNWRMQAYRVLERWLLTAPAHVITVAPTMHREISALRGPLRATHLVLNAIDPQQLQGSGDAAAIRARCNCTSDSVLLGAIGRLSREKGHAILLRAFSQLIPQHPSLRLLIVGDGPELESLKRQASADHLDGNVFFHPYSSFIKDYYQAIDLLVLPSLSEGLPNVLLESMVMEVPAVATDVGAVREVIEDGINGWIVPAGDAHALAVTIREVISNPATMLQFGQLAKSSLFPKFDPHERGKKFLDIYRTLLSKDSNKSRDQSK